MTGRLHNTKCYLVGPIEQDSNPDSWRNKVTEKLNKLGVRVYDPLKKPNWAPQLTVMNKNNFLKALNDDHINDEARASHDAMHWIRDIDRRFVQDADFIICYMPKIFSSGTGEEITIASDMNKPILIYNDDDELVPSSWLACMLCRDVEEIKETFFPSMEAITEYLGKVDNNEVEIDPFKWVFLSYFLKDTKVKNVKHNY